WMALGSGMNSRVTALAVSGSNVYAGGWFKLAGDTAANHVAKWNGISWSPLGSGLDGPPPPANPAVKALAISGTNLYAGGWFTSPANYIARWDGSIWSALGSGMGGIASPEVLTLAVSGSDLLVGGQFTQAGGSAATNIAKWNGSVWSAL